MRSKVTVIMGLITLFCVFSYSSNAKGEAVVWQIDSNLSFIRLEIPDQSIPINANDPPVPLGVRDYSGPFFSPPASSWTDVGGKKSAVQGTISTEYVEGTSIEFSAGAHTATAVHFGSFRPDLATWNGTTFDANSTAPAAFGAALIFSPGDPAAFVAGFAAIREVGYDLLGVVSLSASGSDWIGANNFQAGVVPGAQAHVATLFGHANEVLSDTVNSENSGSLTIENLGSGMRRMTLEVDVPVEIDVGEGVVLSASAVGTIVATATIVDSADVVAQFAYHAGFSGTGTPPDNRIDTLKQVAQEGGGPTALGFSNLINTSHGVNGIVFDIQNLGNGGALNASDFEVQLSPTGAFDTGANPPAGWALGPAPSSVTVIAGSPDRVIVQWPNNSIMNRWLRLTIKANANTGLTTPETYYLGHLLGETTGLAGSVYTVAFADITPIRAEAGQSVTASSITDIDKSGTVSFADISAMRSNVGAQLSNVTIP